MTRAKILILKIYFTGGEWQKVIRYFPTNTVCWYRFTPGVSSIKSIKIEIPSMSNANAEVYTETSTNVFSFQGLVASGNSLNVTIDNKNSVWVLVNPTANNAYAYVSAYASPYSSKSSSLSGGAIAAIVICILMSWLFHAYLIGIFALVFRLKINKSKGMENKKGTQENKNSQNPNNNQNLEENKAQSIHQKAKSYKYLDNTASVDKEHINIPPINNRPPNTVNNLSPYPVPEPFIYTPRGIGNGQPINSLQNHYIPYEPVHRLHQNPDRNVNLPEPPSNNV